jgi:hypothetical protein
VAFELLTGTRAVTVRLDEVARVRLRSFGPPGVVVTRVLERVAVTAFELRERLRVRARILAERERVLEVVGALDPFGEVRKPSCPR